MNNYPEPADDVGRHTADLPCQPHMPSGCDLLAELGRVYRSPLQQFFRKRGCARTQAEDLTQDVFLRLIAYQRSNRILNINAFVFQSAANLLRDTIRSRKRWAMLPLDDKAGSLSAPCLIDTVTPERIVESRQDLEVVAQAFDELDARTQTILLMNRIDMLRHRDIADQLGLSVSLVEKVLRSARRHIEFRFGRQRISKRKPLAGRLGASLCPSGTRTV